VNDVYRAVDDPGRLLAPERDPRTGKRMTARRARDEKSRDRRARRARRGMSRGVLVGAAAAGVVLAAGAVGAAVAIGGGSDDDSTATTVITAPADPSKAAKGEVLVEYSGLTATSDVYDPPETPKDPLRTLPLFCSRNGCRFNSLVARNGRISGRDTSVKGTCGNILTQTLDVRLTGTTTVKGVEVPARVVGTFHGSIARVGDQCTGRVVTATVDARPG
jgi:hypothetical protein